MKLRIQDNLLRLRLTQKEVARLHENGLVENAIRFPPGRALTYSVASSSDADEISVDYYCDSIRVVLPREVVTVWAESNQVSLEGSRHLPVQILVEKDFQCLHKPEERDPDAYPNPLESSDSPAGAPRMDLLR
jgi:hypothetical protein